MKLKHKGYTGRIIVDDGIFVTIDRIRDCCIAECASMDVVEREFIELVDGYLEDCKSINRNQD